MREPDLSADEERADMVRALILAVAALAKTCAPDVVAYGAHRPLVAFAAGGADVVAQMYAAGGVRNLARHNGDTSWGVHRELVVVDCVTALVRAMEADDVQTKRFGVLAFGDLMLSGHHKVRLIRLRLRNAFEPFAKLMRDAHPGVAQVVIRVLTDLFNGGEGVVPKELGELIAKECGQLVNGCVKRGDVSALKCVRAMCQDEIVAQGMVDNGLIEVLISGVRGGKGECLEQSIAALYELSSRAELMPLIVSRGGLRAVIQRPCLEHDAIWAASFLANVARKSEYQAEVSHGALRVLLIATTSKNEHAIREGVRALYNLSLGGVSKVMVCQGGGLLPLIKVARNCSGETRRLAIGAIAELSASLDQATTLIEGGVVSVLLDSVREDDSLQRDVARCLGQLSQVPEVHGSLARSGAATWLVEMVQQNGGRGLDSSDVLYFATVSLSNLAYSAGIGRDAVRDSGVGRVLTALSSAGMSGQMVLNVARQALNNLRGAEKPVLLQLETPGRSGVAA